jgi:hypothetical protein
MRHILLKSILVEMRVPVVVGIIDMNGGIHSTETKKSHRELGFLRGKCWRYSPYTKILYWHGDDSEHDKDDEFGIEDHLLKKYDYTVKQNVTLESGDEYDASAAFPGHFNDAHGYME